MRPRILICDSVLQSGIDILSSAGFDVTYLPKISREELIARVAEFDALVVRGRTKVTADVLEAAKNLKVVGRAGAGLDNIDLRTAQRKGIKVLNTPEASTNAVAEMTIGLMLCLTRRICGGDAGIKSDVWLKNEIMGVELKSRTLGIIGLGRIGKRVAKLARGFDMKILAYDIAQMDDEVLAQTEAEMVDLDTLLTQSDFVTLHIPLTIDTFHLVNSERLRKMKRSAYLINTSRGNVVDEEALLQALQEGWIRGAALDVYGVEPPVNSKLVKLANVVCAPHIGSQTVEAQDSAIVILAEKVIQSLPRIG